MSDDKKLKKKDEEKWMIDLGKSLSELIRESIK